MADTPNGETVTPGDSQTTVQTTSTPSNQGNQVDTAEVERLRKEAEQAKMRAQQLENEKLAREKTDEEARQKQLEEQNEWKTIAEQNQAKLDAFEREREESVKKIELETAEAEILKEFPQDVADAAKDLDLGLSENSEEAKEALKTKLTKLSEKVSAENRVTSNNGKTNTNTPDRQALMVEHAKQQTITPGETPQYHEALSKLNWVQGAKAINGDE